MSRYLSLLRRLGHLRAFAFIGNAITPLDRAVGRLTRGKVLALGLPSLLLTTIGRRSGERRTSPLLYVRDGDDFVIAGTNFGQAHTPAWALNLLAEPAAEVTVRGVAQRVRGHLVEGAERERLWKILSANWPPYETYTARAGGRTIMVFRLEPVRDAG